jgi:hypothetical protein
MNHRRVTRSRYPFRGKLLKYVVVVAVGLVVVPVVLAATAVAATAILGEWFDFQLFDFSNISVLDWLAGGPGAGANSFENYVTFMVSGAITVGGFAIMAALWAWATKSD